MMLVTSRPFARQPVGIVGIDRAGDGQHVCSAWLPTVGPLGFSPLTMQSAIEHYPGISAVKRYSPAGAYVSSDDIANDIAVNGPGCAANSPFTIDVGIYYAAAPASDVDVFIGETTSNDGNTVRVRIKTDGTVELRINDYSGGNVERYLTTATPLSVGPHAVRITLDAARTASLYVDGALRARQASFIAGYVVYSSVRLFYRAGPRGYYSALHNAACPVKILGFVAYSAALPPKKSMWRAFARPKRYLFVPAGSGNLSASASGQAAASGTASPSAQVALSAVGVALASGSAAAKVLIPLSAAGVSIATGSANRTATVTISGAGLAQAAGQAGLSASVLLQAAGAAQAAGNAALAAQLTALATGAVQATGSANLTGGAPGALSASGQAQAAGAALLSISIGLSAAGAAQAAGGANLSGGAPGALAATGAAMADGWATVSVLVTLTAAGFVQAMGTGSFSAQIPLAATGQASASGSASASLAGLVRNYRLACSPAAAVTRIAASASLLTHIQHEVMHG